MHIYTCKDSESFIASIRREGGTFVVVYRNVTKFGKCPTAVRDA